MADLGVSLIVSLAKAGYESCLAVKENQEAAARIAERLTWIIRRSDKWKYLCEKSREFSPSSETSQDTFDRLRKALEDVNLVMEAASKERKTWRSKIKKLIGAKDMSKAMFLAEGQLNIVLYDLGMDQTMSQTSSIMESRVRHYQGAIGKVWIRTE